MIKAKAAETQTMPKWAQTIAQITLVAILLGNLFLFDDKVPEVAGDPRWFVTHIGTAALALFTFTLLALGKARLAFASFKDVPLAIWAALATWGFAALSLIDAENIYRGLWLFQHFSSYVLLFLLTFIFYSNGLRLVILWTLTLGVALNATLGILQYFAIGDSQIQHVIPFWPDIAVNYFMQAAPPAATFSNKNLAASVILISLCAPAYLLLTSSTRWQQTLAATSFTLGTIFLVYTRTRASWLAGILTLIALGIWLALNKDLRQHITHPLKEHQRLAITAVALIAILISSQFQSALKNTYAVSDSAIDRLTSITRMRATPADLGPRLAYNLNGLMMLKDHPINGVGLGNFHTYYPRYHNAAYPTPKNGFNMAARPRRTHNDIGQFLFETGIFGGLSYGLLFLSVVGGAISTCRRKQVPEHTKISLALGTFGVTAMGINALMDFPLQMPAAPALLWTLAGVIVATCFKQRKHKPELGTPNRFARPVFAVIGIATAAYGAWLYEDNTARYQAEIYLKPAMGMAVTHNFGDAGMQAVERAYLTHKKNQRVQEYRAVFYANHKGNIHHSAQKDIEVMQEALSTDPYAPNLITNLINARLKRINELGAFGDATGQRQQLALAMDDYNRLIQVAPPSRIPTYLGAVLHDTSRNYGQALQLYQQVLQYTPNDPAIKRRMQEVMQLAVKQKVNQLGITLGQ